MAEAIKLPKVKSDQADAEIRRIAKMETHRFIPSDHAHMRMLERNITLRQIQRVVMNGDLTNGPIWCTEVERGWKCEYRYIVAGVRISASVKLIDRSEGMFDLIITAFEVKR